jgi:hypothetical protein
MKSYISGESSGPRSRAMLICASWYSATIGIIAKCLHPYRHGSREAHSFSHQGTAPRRTETCDVPAGTF